MIKIITSVVFVLAFVGMITTYFWQSNSQSEITPVLLSDALPLYSEVNWSPEVSGEYYGKEGVMVSSEIIPNITNIAEITLPFETYYRDLLLNRGWQEDITLAAGGPGSAVIGYTKNNAYIILSYQSDFLVQNENEPAQCPCAVQFSVFTSTKNDTDSPLDASEDPSVTEENSTERYVGTIDRVKVVFEHTDYTHYRLTTNELVREGALNTERGYKDDIDATVYVLNWQQPEGEQMRYVRLTENPDRLYLLDTEQNIVTGSVLTLVNQ